MVKAEWGSKRSCPKCGERFYDLGKEDPCVCIECGNQWTPEPVLKSKQPIPFAEVKKKEEVEGDADLGGGDDIEDLDVDEDDDSPDNDVDLGGDDDLAEIDTGNDEPDDTRCCYAACAGLTRSAAITACRTGGPAIKGCLSRFPRRVNRSGTGP